jgi:hypothetical protein
MDELPDQNIANKASFNTSRSHSSYNCTQVGNEQMPPEIYKKSNLKAAAPDDAKSGIQLYQPKKKSIKISVEAKSGLEVPSKN